MLLKFRVVVRLFGANHYVFGEYVVLSGWVLQQVFKIRWKIAVVLIVELHSFFALPLELTGQVGSHLIHLTVQLKVVLLPANNFLL